MKMLEINNLSKNFGGLSAVLGVDINLNEGDLVGLIGPNGAGKTTIFNLLTGVYPISEGKISFRENSLVNKKTHVIANKGITRTFQNIRLFKNLSVLDNVKIGMHKKCNYGLLTSFFRLPKFYKQEEQVRELSLQLLEEVGLADKFETIAENLSYGQQRRLEIARALATQPQLLLLDEPAAGMNPQESQELIELIKNIKKKYNLTVLLIEHDMSVVMNVCERIYVLDYGSIIAEGRPEEIKTNKRVIEAYLGGDI